MPMNFKMSTMPCTPLSAAVSKYIDTWPLCPSELFSKNRFFERSSVKRAKVAPRIQNVAVVQTEGCLLEAGFICSKYLAGHSELLIFPTGVLEKTKIHLRNLLLGKYI